MRKGISPVIAVVLLIAISVIAAVGVWYWVAELAAEPAGLGDDPVTLSVEDCDTTGDEVMIRNPTGTNLEDQTVRIYGPAGEEGEFTINELSAGDVDYFNVTLNLSAGEQYTLTGEGVASTSFTCS